MIWGHFWNVRKGRFRGHGGRRGQTASKSKTTKILNQNLLKLEEIQNLASVTSKMTSTTSKTSEVAEWIFSKITFFKSVHQAEENELLLGFLFRLLQIPVFDSLSFHKVDKILDFKSLTRNPSNSSFSLAWCTDLKHVIFEIINWATS